MKIDRLFGIVYLLLDKKWVTAKYLAEKFQVSTRTIYRDVDVLTLAGIPIYTNKGSGGGIGLLENFTMSKAYLNKEEKNEMLLALEALKKTSAEDYDVLYKMRSIFQEEESFIEIDMSSWTESKRGVEQFRKLRKAIARSQMVSFDYYDADGNYSERKIYPLKLVFKKNHWYVLSYCHMRQQNRYFKVMRMENLLLLNEYFDRNEYMEDIVHEASTPKIELELSFSKDIAHRVYDEFSPTLIKEEDNHLKVKLLIPENEWLYHYLLSFEDHLLSIQPNHIKDKLKAILEKTLKHYLI
jgi:predicted DNA-binding transcriptional regulator YafY